MARAASLLLVAALEGSQVLAREKDRRPGALQSRPDRHESGTFARTGLVGRHPLDSRRSAV